MAEQEPHFHPAVEEIMETSGPDIGRVKDTATARMTARREAMVRDDSQSPESVAEYVDANLKLEAAARAVGHTELAHAIAHDAVGDWPMTDDRLKDNIASAKNSATNAATSYDALQHVSKPANLAQENERLKQSLSEARKKIADHDE